MFVLKNIRGWLKGRINLDSWGFVTKKRTDLLGENRLSYLCVARRRNLQEQSRARAGVTLGTASSEEYAVGLNESSSKEASTGFKRVCADRSILSEKLG
jgi:hypothetical protein